MKVTLVFENFTPITIETPEIEVSPHGDLTTTYNNETWCSEDGDTLEGILGSVAHFLALYVREKTKGTDAEESA